MPPSSHAEAIECSGTGAQTSSSTHVGRRHEAAQLPDVVVSAIDPRAYDEQRTAWAQSAGRDIPAAPDFARPSTQWVVQFLQDFVAVRSDLQR